MPLDSQFYQRVTLKDHLFPAGFAGLCASLTIEESHAGREIQVIVGSPRKVLEADVVKFAKELTRQIRISRGWSVLKVVVEPLEFRELPALGKPTCCKGDLAAWVVEQQSSG